MFKNIEEIYCLIDNFVKLIDKKILKKNTVGRKGLLTRSEYITLGIIQKFIGFHTTKNFYHFVYNYLKKDFRKLPCYEQFCAGLHANLKYLVPILDILEQLNLRISKDIFIVDSSSMSICSNAHRYNLSIDLGNASAGKNLNGWYYGFKIHMIINHDMDIVSVKFTTASTNDLKALNKNFLRKIKGYLIGDKGYISYKKTKELRAEGIELITRSRKNMKKTPANKKVISLLKLRNRVETVFGKLKCSFNMIQKYSRSLTSYFTHILSAIVAYTIDKKMHFLLQSDIIQKYLIS